MEGGWLWIGGDGSAPPVNTGGTLQLKSSHPLLLPLQRKPTQQIIQLQRRRLPSVEDDAEPLIRARNGLWLAIPTPAAGKALDGRRITPAAWERKTGLRLRFVYRRAGPSLLVAPTASRAIAVVPIFLLVPQIKLPKRLDLARDADRALDDIPGLIVANWLEGRL